MSPFSGDVCVTLPVSVELQDGVKGSDDNLSMDHSDISSCDFGPSAVGGRGILVSERVQKHVSPFSGDVCVPLPVSVEFQDGVKGSDDNLSMDHSDISSCDFGPSAVGGRGILVSERVQKHVSPFSGDVCVPLPVSVEFQDGVKGSDDNLSMDHSDISSCDFGPSAVGGRGILVSERVQKHVSPFSGDVCVPLPVSVEFQDGVKGSDDNLSMDHSDISSCDFGPNGGPKSCLAIAKAFETWEPLYARYAYVEVLVANVPSDDDGGILSIICLGTANGGPKSCLAIAKAFETWEPLYARYAYVEVLVANVPSDDDGGILSIICLGTANGGPKSCLAIAKAFETWEPLYARYAYVEVLVANVPSDDDGGILSIICLGTANGGPKSCLAIAKAFETWEPLYARYAYVEVLVANVPSDDDGGILSIICLGTANGGPKSCLAIAKAFETWEPLYARYAYVEVLVANVPSDDDGGILSIICLGTANGGPKSCLAIAKAFETWEPLYARYAYVEVGANTSDETVGV